MPDLIATPTPTWSIGPEYAYAVRPAHLSPLRAAPLPPPRMSAAARPLQPSLYLAPCSRLQRRDQAPGLLQHRAAAKSRPRGYPSGLAYPAGCGSGGELYPAAGMEAGGGGGEKGRVRVWGCQTRPRTRRVPSGHLGKLWVRRANVDKLWVPR
jgi:hypothetical protein